MSTSLTFDEHLEALELAAERLGGLAAEAGMDAAVTTCPAWSVRALLAHQAMVHRWATAHVTGGDASLVPSQTTIREFDDLGSYYADGHRALVSALRAAPADLRALTFLNDAPRPREFWARRQAHETTIHMVDALAGAVGRLPTTEEAAIDTAVAADGIDELLRGFFTRGPCRLYDGERYAVGVRPTDLDRSWVFRVAERLTVDPELTAPHGSEPTVIVTGTAAAIYLALWNRGNEIDVSGAGPPFLDRWRAANRVSWR